MRLLLSTAVLCLIFSLEVAPQAVAEDVAAFYKGRTITIFGAGGTGGSIQKRTLALKPYLTKYLPGSPNVIVKMMPGGGGVRAANHLFNVAPKDGSALGLLQATLAFNQAVGRSGVKYDANKFSFIGSIDPSGQAIFVTEATSVRNMADAKRTEVTFGSTGTGSSTWIVPTLVNNFFGTKFKIITGYKGLRGALLAVERKEVAGIAINWHSLKTVRPDWQLGKEVFVLGQITLERDPGLSNSPTLIELAENETQKKVFEFYGLAMALGVSLAAPPDVPSDRISALRAAIDRTFSDREFVSKAKSLGLRIQPRSGGKLQAIAARTLAIPKNVTSEVRKILKIK